MSKLFITVISLVVIYFIIAIIAKLPPFKEKEKYSDTPYRKLISYCDIGNKEAEEDVRQIVNDDVY